MTKAAPKAPPKPGDPEQRLRRICLTLPEATERLSHSAPTWFFKGKKSFVMLLKQGHHQNQFPHFWCAAGPGVQEDLVASSPEQFFRPPYFAPRPIAWCPGGSKECYRALKVSASAGT